MERREVGGIVILTLGQSLTGGDETDTLRREIKQLPAAGPKNVIINMGNVVHLFSPGIGAIRQAHAECAHSGGRLQLCCPSQRIKRILYDTHLALIIDWHDTEEGALASFPANIPRQSRGHDAPPRPH